VDPAVENQILCQPKCHNIAQEQTPPYLPEYNGKVERTLAYLEQCTYTMILEAKCDIIWCVAAMVERTIIDNLLPRD
jgi:hypothetical protein